MWEGRGTAGSRSLLLLVLVVLLAILGCASSFHVASAAGARPRRRNGGARLFDAAGSASLDTDALSCFWDWLQKDSGFKVADTSVKVGPSGVSGGRGLITTRPVKRGQTAASIPMSLSLSGSSLNGELGRKLAGFDGWTGDIGLIALQLLLARSEGAASKLSPWLALLPEAGSPGMDLPLFWPENLQLLADRSSTRGFTGLAADVADDFERISRELSPGTFDPAVFTLEGFQWGVGCALSRGVVLDGGSLVLAPLIDFANYCKGSASEPQLGGQGLFGTGGSAVKIIADHDLEAGQEVFVNYGNKPAAAYLEEHGFVPEDLPEEAELEVEIKAEDRFLDDKLDILGSQGELPRKTFVLRADSDPDPSTLQFLRLSELDVNDAFLLEAVFRNDVWSFMELPISQHNEAAANNKLLKACNEALAGFEGADETDDAAAIAKGGREGMCATVRKSERRALTRAQTYCISDNDALERKEYYQERRLKELGLDRPLRDDEIVDPGSSSASSRGGRGGRDAGRGLDW